MSLNSQKLKNYTLIISEKPLAGKKIAEALSNNNFLSLEINNAYYFKYNNEEFIVCSSLGHLYNVIDPSKKRISYPILDVEWSLINSKNTFRIQNTAKSITLLSKKANKIIHACDYDIEGETIGFNIITYLCSDLNCKIFRAQFSTLTKDELQNSFQNLIPYVNTNFAHAGRTRHLIDFLFGINISRALSISHQVANHTYKNISIGRVQGPTLAFLVDKEIDIKNFCPVKFFHLEILFKNDVNIKAHYKHNPINQLLTANKITNEIKSKSGKVTNIIKNVNQIIPPFPFNTIELQKEASRIFGFQPTKTLQIAEKLYLNAQISYPRTSSEKLPKNINYHKIFNGLKNIKKYYSDITKLLDFTLTPNEGSKVDSAHPSIYPTGEFTDKFLSFDQKKIYYLIIDRFLSVFANNAVKENMSLIININKHDFVVSGSRLITKGWIKYYKYTIFKDNFLKNIKKGDKLKVVSVNITKNLTKPPSRYNYVSLLEKMEKLNIGTKTTRGEIIQTLFKRDYVEEKNFIVTNLGFALFDTLKKYSPKLLSANFTKDVESQITKIEKGEANFIDVIENYVNELTQILFNIQSYESQIGTGLKSINKSNNSLSPLHKCPKCTGGNLIIVKSTITKKRFVGCSNYPKNCNFSAPLPQKGVIKSLTKLCNKCNYPKIIVWFRKGLSLNLCLNVNCKKK